MEYHGPLYQWILLMDRYIWTVQNYFRDPWNTFDFIIVLGSFVDIVYSEMNVRRAWIAWIWMCHLSK